MRIIWGNEAQSSYLITDRLADVLALIQVLALDEHANRSEDGLTRELQGPPRSTETWRHLAAAHPEFFRVAKDGEHTISLIARYVAPETPGKERPILASDYTAKLMGIAVDLHDRQVRRSERWHVWMPVLGAFVGGLLTLAGVYLKEGVFTQHTDDRCPHIPCKLENIGPEKKP